MSPAPHRTRPETPADVEAAARSWWESSGSRCAWASVDLGTKVRYRHHAARALAAADAARKMSVEHGQGEDDLIVVTMTRHAAAKFRRAVGYAEAVIYSHSEAQRAPEARQLMEEHADWLRWGQSRVDNAAREEQS